MRKEAMSLKWEGTISLKCGYFKLSQKVTEVKATGLQHWMKKLVDLCKIKEDGSRGKKTVALR